MNDEKIQVLTYSGHKAAERPTAFVHHGQEISIVDIPDMWIEENFTDRQRKRFFIVLGSDGDTYILYMVEKTDEWFLRSRA
jgi:hypothetical protein